MTELKDRIIEIKSEDIVWGFYDAPRFYTSPDKGYRESFAIDPFPGYANKKDLVLSVAEKVEAVFPIEFKPKYYLPCFEDISRTNGWSSRQFLYDEKSEPKKWESLIVLNGKRIPIHPAMTSYLVAHEYGHVVDYWICYKKGLSENSVVSEFDKEYAELRKIKLNSAYGGGKWHLNIGEIIANDFRICLTGIGKEFWPHDGVEHPDNLDYLKEFWVKMANDYSYKEI